MQGSCLETNTNLTSYLYISSIELKDNVLNDEIELLYGHVHQSPIQVLWLASKSA